MRECNFLVPAASYQRPQANPRGLGVLRMFAAVEPFLLCNMHTCIVKEEHQSMLSVSQNIDSALL